MTRHITSVTYPLRCCLGTIKNEVCVHIEYAERERKNKHEFKNFCLRCGFCSLLGMCGWGSGTGAAYL